MNVVVALLIFLGVATATWVVAIALYEGWVGDRDLRQKAGFLPVCALAVGLVSLTSLVPFRGLPAVPGPLGAGGSTPEPALAAGQRLVPDPHRPVVPVPACPPRRTGILLAGTARAGGRFASSRAAVAWSLGLSAMAPCGVVRPQEIKRAYGRSLWARPCGRHPTAGEHRGHGTR